MSVRSNLILAAASAGIGLFCFSSAEAAPLNGATGIPAAHGNAVEKANYYGRRCWWRGGRRFCRGYRSYGYYGGYPSYYGLGPSFGLFFGGGGHRGFGHRGFGGHHRGHR